MNMFKRLVKAVTFLCIEVIVIFCSQLVFVLPPDWHHAVYGLFLNNFLELVLSAFFWLLLLHVHFNWETDEVRIFFNDGFQAILFQIFIVLIFFGILFNFQNHFSTYSILLDRLDGIAVCALRLPFKGLVATKRLTDHNYVICYHKRSIEANTELSDDIMTIFGFVLFLKCKGSALRDCS